MGFFDSVQNAMNRGQVAAGRSVETAKINSRIREIGRQRQSLVAQLGASLYEETRENEELRAGREPLYDGIAALDTEREQCLAEIAAIEQAIQADQAAAQTFICPQCGTIVGATDMFCGCCGKPVEEIKAEAAAAMGATSPATSQPAQPYDGPTCPHCGAPIQEDDTFCCSCGKSIA